ncbi:MAG: transcription termination/antitermination NusG family protein [Verrucomicrobiota bacterium]|nr:transcription termination/antitermination NusG family protein [Verrucomicrobiota bacterium]
MRNEMEEITEVMDDTGASQGGALDWYVAHVRPRCEKKLVEHGKIYHFPTTLPTYSSTKKYRGKVVTFHKPLFPGYVFLQLNRKTREAAKQSNYVANMLEVPDQEEFKAQLSDILFALEQKVEIRVEASIGVGNRVLVKSGPLQGHEGWVEERFGMTTVLLRLDFIGQAAAVKVESDTLELI